MGDNRYGTVWDSYSTGAVFGLADAGGLVGDASEGYALNSYWDVQTSGLSESAGGYGMTTAEMRQQGTFLGWDFENTWTIAENISYPLLRSFADSDGDSIPDVQDNCPYVADLNQADADGDYVGDPCDACPTTAAGTPVSQRGCDLVVADLDADGDVDSADAGAFEACAAGPGVAIAGNCGTPDFDTDGDVDSSDFAVLQRCYSGTDQPANPNCL